MMPGDSIQGEIKLVNKYDHPYEIYLRAERITPEEEFDLLKKLTIKINHQDKEIYNGRTEATNGLEENIKICTLNPGETKNIEAVVTLDGSTVGNEYKNKTVEVRWVFTAINIQENIKLEDINNNEIKEEITVEKHLPQTGYNNVYIQIIISLIFIIIGLKNINKRNITKH
ncbi:hypothetical protein [Clostridium sp. K04]|uniref:hypothetical protein n=1 Tax=Clostridium sp. K04 TaxID=2718929 RepID=UPI001C8B87D5|nr:hypothetical protein [Clostridium sp. K04]MBX9186018.1 hypothetical protein [Clostridium sp. K04]